MTSPSHSIADLSALSVDELADFYSVPESSWVRSNMVLSLDGHYADAQGSSHSLSSEFDLTVLLLLRALSDVVVVGGHTARQENYKPKFPRPQFAHLNATPPRLCIVSRSVDFSPTDELFAQDISMPIIVVPTTQDEIILNRIDALRGKADIAECHEVTGTAIVSALADRGLSKILSEGGPYLQNVLRSDDVLDEMDVTIAPVIRGGVEHPSPLGELAGQLELLRVGRGGDHVFARFLVKG